MQIRFGTEGILEVVVAEGGQHEGGLWEGRVAGGVRPPASNGVHTQECNSQILGQACACDPLLEVLQGVVGYRIIDWS